MALIGANELKRKTLITVEGQPYTVIDVSFATPSARGASTMVKTRLRNLLNGAVQEKTFRSSEKFGEPDVQLAPASFLYSDGEDFHFMDESTFDQFTFDKDQIGDDEGYLKEGTSCHLLKFNGTPVSLRLPQFVEMSVRTTEPGMRGDTAAGGATKQATLETGLVIRVPLFIQEGESVRVDTRTGAFVSRA